MGRVPDNGFEDCMNHDIEGIETASNESCDPLFGHCSAQEINGAKKVLHALLTEPHLLNNIQNSQASKEVISLVYDLVASLSSKSKSKKIKGNPKTVDKTDNVSKQKLKWLKSMGGHEVLKEEDLPLNEEGIRYLERKTPNPIPDVTLMLTDQDNEHLKYLRTSSSIDSYNVDKYTSKETISCAICSTPYCKVDPRYHQFCPTCSDFNYSKRVQMADLNGRIAVVTGGRIKIGYEIALKLLRCGAFVITTTRFPKDCIRRYELEKDFLQWKDRLNVYGIDFRDLGMVNEFIDLMNSSYSHLDILVNNAAQTVRKPPKFYQHLLKGEGSDLHSDIKYHSFATNAVLMKDRLIEGNGDAMVSSFSDSSLMSQLILLKSDETDNSYFPNGMYDHFGQQRDLRISNSWSMKLDEVPLIEAFECQVINAMVPFTLCSKLKSLMLKSPNSDRYILNVSAMEGTFYRYKTSNHPHTNMAKASLNMLTRTCASDYASSGIYMTSIDTGWVTDERPLGYGKCPNSKYAPVPLDELDGAMRVLDPCFVGIRDKTYYYGVLMKDYKVSRW